MDEQLKAAFERIKAKVTIDQNGCWNWQGALSKDMYGAIRVGDKVQRTHRVTFTVVHGPIARGKVIRHKCDNALCCNPDHLVVGDHEDNTQDQIERQRFPRRVLSREEIQRIREMRGAGATKREIAVALQCNWYAVSRVLDEFAIDQPRRRGRPKGSRNVVTRVTDEAKQQMRDLYATGQFTQSQLAERFGCDQTYVSLIVRGLK